MSALNKPGLMAAVALLAGAAALGGGLPEVSRPARLERTPDESNERLNKAEKKRARKAAQRARLATKEPQP